VDGSKKQRWPHLRVTLIINKVQDSDQLVSKEHAINAEQPDRGAMAIIPGTFAILAVLQYKLLCIEFHEMMSCTLVVLS
jgi:hypothetical protein